MTKRSCRISCADIFWRIRRLELLVNIESLEFPVDGLAQAVISVATVELTDPDTAAPEGRVPAFGERVAGGARRPRR